MELQPGKKKIIRGGVYVKQTSVCAAIAAVASSAAVVGRKIDFGLALPAWKWFDTGLTTQWKEASGT